ncbi:MAG TPA: CopG family transcriptional regulator, partial [Planctomycetota bacterium]|nr:CopG family transcriptional regulator [Planctomycetota bacterium]
MERAAVDVAALDQQVRKCAGGAELAELRPEAALEHGGVEVEHPLALDERVGAHGVVARRERRGLDLGAELGERLGDAALPLVHVDDDLHRLRLRAGHERILALRPRPLGMLAYVKRTTVKIPDELDVRLRLEARRRGLTISELTREAIEAHLGDRRRRRLLAAGAGSSGRRDISERIEEILR